MTAGIGATTPPGTIQRTPIETVVHPIVKGTLETITAKAMLVPALRHTIPPDLDGKHYITAEDLTI